MGYRAMQEASFGHATTSGQNAQTKLLNLLAMGLAVVGRRQGVVGLLVFTFRWMEGKLHMV